MKLGKPQRGTKWRAGASHWEESTRTIRRFGRDVYDQLLTEKEAKKLAETIYNEAVVYW